MRFARLRAPGGRRGWIDREAPEPIAAYLPDPARRLEAQEGTRIKSKGSRSLTLAPEGFLVKHFYARNRWRSVLHSLIPSPAANAWRNHRALAEAGFPAPRPLASIVVRRPFPIYRESWFLLELLPGTTNFRDLLIERHALFASNDPARLEPFRRAADLLARLHLLGWFHQDLNAKNLLIDKAGRYWMIDFDGSIRLGRLPYLAFLILRFTDLRRFYASLRFWIRRTDRERFLRWYFDRFPGGDRERRLFHVFLRVTAFLSGYEAKKSRRDVKAARALGLDPDAPAPIDDPTTGTRL